MAIEITDKLKAALTVYEHYRAALEDDLATVLTIRKRQSEYLDNYLEAADKLEKLLGAPIARTFFENYKGAF